MIKNITATGSSRDHIMKRRPHTGATNTDMCDYIRPEYVTTWMSSFYIVEQTIFRRSGKHIKEIKDVIERI